MIMDAPLENSKGDQLGFEGIARHLAKAFLQNDLSEGFIVGVEGAWGSGKSSLVNMALEKISREEGGPRVVKFAPWLVGNRNELLVQLFSDLEPVILEAVPATEKERTKKILGRYAQVSSGLAAIADLADMGGVPLAKGLSKILQSSGRKAATLSENSLGELNENLRSKLKMLEHPIIVFVDDLDRLEPTEAAEVLRLVKAVADFPNVAYILAYDLEVLAKSIETAINISDGKAYLEKVVQASFKVPKAMNFDLRNWLKTEVWQLLEGLPLSLQAKERLDGVFQQWCGEFVETPRDVIRVLNSLRLNFLPVKDLIDPGDMVFLHLLRSKNSALYNWIEEYVSSLSAIGDWGHISPGAHERMGEMLLDAIDKKGDELNRYIFALSEHIPGLDTMSLIRDGVNFRVFDISEAAQLREFSTSKRLASPNHHSYFFSFSHPSGSVSDLELDQFLSACEHDPEKAILRFRQQIEVQRPQGGRLAEALLDRVVGAGAKITSAQVEGLFAVFKEVLDELVPYTKNDFGYTQFLKGSRHEVFGLIELIDSSDTRAKTLETLFSDGKSLAWLAGIIRETIFAHGVHGDQADPEDTWLLTAEELELIKKIFLKRLTESQPSSLLKVPHFLSLMYAWHQVGDAEGALSWISHQTASDPGFLAVLEKMKSWSDSSSEGVQYKLRPETLDTFFGGASAVKHRLKLISKNDQNEDTVRFRAAELLTKFES